jgi:biopolymer transport protein TolQ
MNQDLDIFQLVANASVVVKAVLILLVAISVMSWTAIFRKIIHLHGIKQQNDVFMREYAACSDFESCLNLLRQRNRDAGPMERIFESGLSEMQKFPPSRATDPRTVLERPRRAMRACFQREMDAVESNLSFLASVGSVSPYLGLFGTVWGIMHAFTGLASLQQVTLATVAPGIAEALVATAIGLFAAIPAVIAYNFFARDIDRISIEQETFIDEFSNMLQLNYGAPASQNAAR